MGSQVSLLWEVTGSGTSQQEDIQVATEVAGSFLSEPLGSQTAAGTVGLLHTVPGTLQMSLNLAQELTVADNHHVARTGQPAPAFSFSDYSLSLNVSTKESVAAIVYTGLMQRKKEP